MSEQNTYIITGRIPDEENVTLCFQAKSFEEATSKFTKQMYEDEPEAMKWAIEKHGEEIYLDNVTEVTGQFDVHLSSGWPSTVKLKLRKEQSKDEC